MAKVIVTLEIMPENNEVNLDEIETKAKKAVKEKEGIINSVNREDVAFGLKKIIIKFAVDENKGSPDPIAEGLEKEPDVASAQITMVSRALG
ncbi:elongation factor 1-beta [Candidatus Woesearchaeota archaeon]|nr:elongation factor 1-beta [Candidatus Woesearchaeota archaeon]